MVFSLSLKYRLQLWCGLKDHPAFYQLPLGSCPCLTVDSPQTGLCIFTWLTPSFSSLAICSNITSSKQSFPVSHTTSPLQLTLALCTFHWLPSSQFSSIAQKCLTICDPMDAALQASLSITSFQSLLKLMSIESVMPSNHLILCRPLLLLSSIFPSIRVFSNESTLHMRWPKYWSFSFGIILSKEHPGLIFFRMDWLDLVVQGTLKSLLQQHSSKASILWHSAFFIVQLSHPSIHDYWKNHSLD